MTSPDSRAIIIGVSSYQDSAFPQIPAAANSLAGMRDILTDPQLCGWPEDRVEVIANPVNPGRLAQRLRRIARDTRGVLLLYFVGHGTLTPDGELCLALSDTDAGDADLTGLEYAKIKGVFRDSPAGTKMAILDCCYSGRAIEALAATDDAQLADSTAVQGVYTLTAADRTAHVVPIERQATACTSFTAELLDLVRTGIPGGAERLTLRDLYGHLVTRLRARDLPRPNQRGTDTADRYPFTRNAAPVEGGLTFAVDVEVSQNKYQGPNDTDVHAIVTVTANEVTAPVMRAIVFLIGVSDPEVPAPAIAETINALPDGTWFALVEGGRYTRMLYPTTITLAQAGPGTKAAATAALGGLQPTASPAFGRWLRRADQLFTGRDLNIRHAVLITDTAGSGETPAELAHALERHTGRFTCDTRGIGTDWQVAELRSIAEALSGTVDIVPAPDGLTNALNDIVAESLGQTVSGPVLQVQTTGDASVLFVKQIAPTIVDLTARGHEAAPQVTEYPCGVWRAGTRDFHVALRTPPQPENRQLDIAYVRIVAMPPAGAGETLASGQIHAIWTADL
ncbi:caspase family protein [Actinocrispum sp. NPDC049592]|uniref:caspase, EACC1-associated type n=1 Tax=Actinocrispum sp. NPDC049592 TaxID=3154835 RepID=UPI003422D488